MWLAGGRASQAQRRIALCKGPKVRWCFMCLKKNKVQKKKKKGKPPLWLRVRWEGLSEVWYGANWTVWASGSQLRAILSPTGHWAMSEGIFGFHNWRLGCHWYPVGRDICCAQDCPYINNYLAQMSIVSRWRNTDIGPCRPLQGPGILLQASWEEIGGWEQGVTRSQLRF